MKGVLFLLLFGAAWIYDSTHRKKLPDPVKTEKPAPENNSAGLNFCFTSQAVHSLKIPLQKITPERLYQEKLIRLLQEHLAIRSYLLLKAEVLKQPETLLSSRNLISIRYYSHTNPDEIPPAS